jgi:hypothetical protein
MINELPDFWAQSYGNVPPLGHLLRDQFAECWVRFYALPAGKRYADNDHERSIILSRANALADEIFDPDNACWLLSSRPEFHESIIDYDPQGFVRETRKLQKMFSWHNRYDDPDDPLRWSTSGRLINWLAEMDNDLISKIADDEEFGVLWFSVASSEVFAPYDGGFDLILKDAERVRNLKEKFSTWLSPRKDGF